MTDMIEGKVRYENLEVYPVPERAVIASRLVIQDYHIDASDALHVFISGAIDCDYFISGDRKLIRQLRTGKYKLVAFNVRVKGDREKLSNLLPS